MNNALKKQTRINYNYLVGHNSTSIYALGEIIMYKITKVEHLSEKNWLMEVEAPYVTRRCLPGQFLIVRSGELGERIPLTICDYDRERETVTIVFQTIGESSYKIAEKKAGSSRSWDIV